MNTPVPERLILNTDLRSRPPGACDRPNRDPSLLQLRPGAYVEAEYWGEARPSEKYRLRVLAAESAARSQRVYSHEAAAVLLGMPMFGALPRRVHVLVDAASGGRSTGHIIRHGVPVMPETTTVDEGLVVTAPARTVIDLARSRAFDSALVCADYALATRMCTTDDLLTEVERIGDGRGARMARYVVERADDRAESPGESLSRARMYELGLPIPELQVEFFDDDGFIGRVDFWWEEFGVIGEFDGRMKYGAENRSAEDDLWDEKRREDRLRRRVKHVTRWVWRDAMSTKRFEGILTDAGIR